jgi:Protein of unknown function (DUF2568)
MHEIAACQMQPEEERLQSAKVVNLAVRFGLELCALALFAYWGFKTGDSTAISILLGIAAPLAMTVVWGAFVAPKSRVSLPRTVKWILGLAILLLSAIALADAGRSTLAVVFGVASMINAVLMAVWER